MHYEILSGQTKKGNKKAGDGNRTHVSSLEGWCSTIELHPHVVGVTGFEPATSWSQTRRSSQAEPHPEGFVCVLSVTQELVYSKGKNMSTTFFIFFIFFLKWLPVSLKKLAGRHFIRIRCNLTPILYITFTSISFMARRALPRWLMAFFCWGVSSAEEQPYSSK